MENLLLLFAITTKLMIKSTKPKSEPTMIPTSATVLSFEEASVGPFSLSVVGIGVVNGLAEDWNEVESATNVRSSAKVTEKFPLVTRSLRRDSAVKTVVSPGPPGSKVNETRILPRRA